MKKTIRKARSDRQKKTAKAAAKSAANTLFARVQKCVDSRIRPFIQMDGGEIELLELTKDGILKVRLHGACHGCPAAGYTLSYGVQAAINEDFPNEDIQVLLVE